MSGFEKVLLTTDDTLNLGYKLGTKLQNGDIILLEGDLGAGKTTFTKGLAKGLEIEQMVNSPTFTIIKEYEGRLPLYHMDVYRVSDGSEELGLEEYFYGEGVSVIEWAHLIEEQLPKDRLTINIYHSENNSRIIKFVPVGDRYESLCKEIFR